jgi:hypothetical protein
MHGAIGQSKSIRVRATALDYDSEDKFQTLSDSVSMGLQIDPALLAFPERPSLVL